VNPDERDSFGGTALHAAMFQKNPAIITLLIEHGFDVNAQGPANGYTPLHDAVWANNLEAIKILLAHGAKTDIKGKDGLTPYAKAKQENKPEIASYLETAPAASKAMIEIPLTFDRANLPMVDLTLNEQQEKCYLDTGARGLHLPKAIAEKIQGLQLTGKTVKSIDLAGKVREDETFIIPEVRLNGMVFRDLPGQFLSPWGFGKSEFQLPVIGLDVFQRKELVIDFPQKRLLVSEQPIPFAQLYPSAQNLPMTLADEGLVISVQVGGQELPMVLDCAASISMLKTSAKIDTALLSPCTLELPGGACEMVSGYAMYGTERLALQLIRQPLPEQFKPMGIVGHDFFSQCALYLSANSDVLKIACTKQ
jgi:hypothetical protein